MWQSETEFEQTVASIKDLYREYPPEEIAAALFVSSLWLPNISSPAKHILFTMVLCAMKPEEFVKNSPREDYETFRKLLSALYELSPNFMTLEDYVPEPDWGELRFPLGRKKFRIFYGGDLEDAYDQLTLFEVLYRPFSGGMTELAGRSPLDDLERALALQDAIIRGILSQPTRETLDISPGDVSVPAEAFWRDAKLLYKSLDLNSIVGTAMLQEFSVVLGKLPLPVLSRDKLEEALVDSRIFPFMFIEHSGRYLPMLPRRMSAVLFDAWGGLLKRHQAGLAKDGSALEDEIAISFCSFVRERFSKSDAFYFVSAREGEKKAHRLVFPVAIKSRDKLILFYILPPAADENTLARKLTEVAPALKESERLLQHPPTQLILHLDSQRIEFRSEHSNGVMTPVIVILITKTHTGPMSLGLESDLPGRIESMDSVLAILDEVYEVERLSDFLEYLERIEQTVMSPLTSLLDKFASFQDSDAVLIGGAVEPNLVMLDPHWGSRFRYQSLARFWSLYPERDFFGPPRSWQIHEEGARRIRLVARSFLGAALHCEVGKAQVFLTCPYEQMPYEQGRIANFLVECAEDNFYQHRDAIGAHRIFETYQDLVIQFFPHALVKESEAFRHLRHLDPGVDLWRADAGFPDTRSVGVRIVFNAEAVQEAFLKVQDRSLETALLVEIVRQLDFLRQDSKTAAMVNAIEKGRGGRPRFKFGAAQKPASFPELVKACLPTERDFKLAKKRLAELAKQEGLTEGRYGLAAAKQKLGALRKAMIAEINAAVAKFDFARSIPLLLGWADSVSNEREREKIRIKLSLEHEVDYRREDEYSKNEEKFTLAHRNHRYLVEKFVQLQPKGKEVVSEADTRFLLAFIDWFFVIVSARDVIHYEISPTGLSIDSEFLVDVEYAADTKDRQVEFAREDAAVRLGAAGNPRDEAKHPQSVAEQMAALDVAFNADYGFKFTNLVSVLIVLTHWPEQHEGAVEAMSYSATQEEIATAAQKAVAAFEGRGIGPILDFLTLKPGEVLRVIGETQPCDDLPVWEHNKRGARYAIRPLIRIGDRYHWGPYAVRTAGLIWSGSPSSGTLPVDIGKANVGRLLEQWKHLLDDEVESKAAEIVKRFTPHVAPSARLHKLDRAGKHPEGLGDYDVLAYYPKVNALLSIECKNMLPVFCIKDARRLRQTIFGVPGKDDGHFRQIDKRQKYLQKHWGEIAKMLKWPLALAERPTILSLYVTPIAYWWTRFPPRKVDTTFLRIEMLEKFLLDL